MKRWVFGLVFVLLAVPLLALQQALPAAAEEPATGRFASCLAGQRSGDLLVLMDESGSLRWTDPQGDRVVAAQFLLDRLTDLAERTRSELSIKLVGFGTRYLDHASPWVVASQDTLPALRESVAQYRDRDNELGTDYWLGLDGARQELAARQTGEVSRCQAVVFFSDGQLDIQPPRGEQPARPYAPNNPLRTEAERQAATAAAAESLCRPGGVADQLRTQGIVLFGVGLEGHDAAHPAPANQFDLMTSLATGAGPIPVGR
ncbi:vWA domain-containing protein [Propioniciclava flava]